MSAKTLLKEFGSRQLNAEELTEVQQYVLNRPGSIREVIEAMRNNALRELNMNPEDDFLRPYLKEDEEMQYSCGLNFCFMPPEAQTMAESRSSLTDDDIWAAISKELLD